MARGLLGTYPRAYRADQKQLQNLARSTWINRRENDDQTYLRHRRRDDGQWHRAGGGDKWVCCLMHGRSTCRARKGKSRNRKVHHKTASEGDSDERAKIQRRRDQVRKQ